MMTQDEYYKEQALDFLHYEAVMKRAKMEQIIYLFVEGDSEEVAFDELLMKSNYDIEKEGIVVANYYGIGNLKKMLKFLRKTLSYQRPVLITYDNDIEGRKILTDVIREYGTDPLIKFFPIPQTPIVKYDDNIEGGSFEEMFDINDFLSICFSEKLIKENWELHLNKFKNQFDVSKPWLKQVESYLGKHKYKINKKELAEILSTDIKIIPDTIIKLKDALQEVRLENPIKHPDDVDLPRVYGLTC